MTRAFVAGLVLSCVCGTAVVHAQDPGPEQRQAEVYIVQPGDSLFAIVKTSFPQHQGSWLEVAEQLMVLNPGTFPDGLDTPLRPGMQLRLSATPASGTNAAPASQSTGSTGTQGDSATRNDDAAAQVDSRDTVRPGLVPTTPAAGAAMNARPRPSIGEVISVTGRLQALNGYDSPRRLAAGDPVKIGESVQTTSQSTASIRLLDGAVYALQTATRITFENFAYSAPTKTGRSVITLISGGFRGTSGLLGSHDPDNVTYNTPLATLGIRNADFSVRLCTNENCRTADGSTSFPEGLYVGVLTGNVVMINNSGEVLARAGEVYRIMNPDNVPAPAPAAATLLLTPAELVAWPAPELETHEPLSFWAWLKQFLFGA